MNYYIESVLDRNEPSVTNLVTGAWGDKFPIQIFAAREWKAGPFTTRILEAAIYAVKERAQERAFLLATMYPYFVGKIKVVRLRGRRQAALLDYQIPGHHRSQSRDRSET